MNIEELKEEIKNIQEPRRTRYGNIRHKLEDIIIIGLCTIICGGEDFADREYQLLTNLSWLEQKDEWNGLNALGCAKSTIAENREIREFTRYFITSLTVLETFADSMRKHWSIENQLHWCLDVVFREDASRARKDNSPLNLNVLRKTALNLVSQAQYKRISKKRLMFRAALEPTLFLDILFDPSSVSPQK